MIPSNASTIHLGRTNISPLRIPPEILIEIIDEAANGCPTFPAREMWSSEEWYDKLKPYPCQRLCNYMLVSLLWYQTIVGAPRLWAKMRLETSDTTTDLEAEKELYRMNCCLARSGEHLLDITLAGWSGSHHALILPTLLQTCRRWRTLTIFCTFEQELFREAIEMPRLGVLRIPYGLGSSIKMKAEALRTILIREDEIMQCDPSVFQQSLERYPEVTSLSCREIHVYEATADTFALKLSSTKPLPNLVHLELIDCRRGDFDALLQFTLLRVSPALQHLTLHLTTEQRFQPYWRTLCSPVRRLEILPEDLDRTEDASQNLTCLLLSLPFVETICWRAYWYDQVYPPTTSAEPLLQALSRARQQNQQLAPRLRHIEFEEIGINKAQFFSFCRERSTEESSGKHGAAGEIQCPLRITIHRGCVFKDDDDNITPIPRVEDMSWLDLENMGSSL